MPGKRAWLTLMAGLLGWFVRGTRESLHRSVPFGLMPYRAPRSCAEGCDC